MKIDISFLYLLGIFCLGLMPRTESYMLLQSQNDYPEDFGIRACVKDTEYCGIGPDKCIIWRHSKYKDSSIFRNTTICKFHPSYYWCPTARGSWDYCYNNCEKQKGECQYNVFYLTTSSSVHLNLSTLPFKFLLLLSNTRKGICSMFTHCGNCDNIRNEVKKQFRECTMTPWTLIEGLQLDVPSLSQNTEYKIHILPVIDKSILGLIKQFSVTTKLSKPTGPSNIRLIGKTSTTITIDWDPSVETDSNGRAEKYELIQHGLVNPKLVESSIPLSEMSGLTPCQRYCFSVAALNKAGRSGLSSKNCSYTRAAFSKIMSLEVNVDQLQLNSVVKWAYNDFYNCSIIFRIHYNIKDAINSERNISTDKMETKLSYIKPNKIYMIRVRPEFMEDMGEYSDFKEFSTIQKPAIPTNVRLVNKTHSNLILTWDVHEETDAYGRAEKFEIVQQDLYFNDRMIIQTNLHRVGDLSPCQRYCFTVVAINTAGTSKNSTKSCFYTKAIFSEIFLFPIEWNAKSKKAVVKWKYNNPNFCLVKFTIKFHTKNMTNTKIEMTTDKNQFELSGLYMKETYVVQVRPEFQDEHGQFSDYEEFVTTGERASKAGLISAFIIVVILLLIAVLFYKRKSIITWIRKCQSRSEVILEKEFIEIAATPANAEVKRKEKSPQSKSSSTNISVSIYQKSFKLEEEKANLIKEFKDLLMQAELFERKMNLTTNTASLQDHKNKNRFVNILPFDQTRIALKGRTPENDYINANYIPFKDNETKMEYIACQGPLELGLSDFWLMIWEQNISMIVMLTRISEGDKVKCSQYWPNEINVTKRFGESSCISVSMEKESKHDVFYERNLKIWNKSTNETRNLIHLHMTVWLDYSAPTLEEFGIFLFRYHELLNFNNSSPTVVHCSAGVGRTGTFMVIDRVIRKLIDGHTYVNVFEEVLELRKYRKFMVQRQAQYNFIHEFIQYFLKKYMQTAEEETIYFNTS